MDWKVLTKNKWLLFLAAVGVLLLLIGSFIPSRSARPTFSPLNPAAASQRGDSSQPQAQTADTSQISSASELEASYDQQLEQILSTIAGIHAVKVMVTVDSSGTLSVAKNDSASKTVSGAGGSTSTTTTTKTDQIYTAGSSGQGGAPYVLSRQQPKVRGVLVTVNADDFVVAKSEIIESITNVLDVPEYKISVEPQKDN